MDPMESLTGSELVQIHIRTEALSECDAGNIGSHDWMTSFPHSEAPLEQVFELRLKD